MNLCRLQVTFIARMKGRIEASSTKSFTPLPWVLLKWPVFSGFLGHSSAGNPKQGSLFLEAVVSPVPPQLCPLCGTFSCLPQSTAHTGTSWTCLGIQPRLAEHTPARRGTPDPNQTKHTLFAQQHWLMAAYYSKMMCSGSSLSRSPEAVQTMPLLFVLWWTPAEAEQDQASARARVLSYTQCTGWRAASN